MDRFQAALLLAAIFAALSTALIAFILKCRTGATGAAALLYGGSAGATFLIVFFTAISAYR